MNKFDWNDFRYVVAVASERSAAGAARQLGVSHATVLRRIQTLEQVVGAPLFYRLRTGYEPTEAGQRLADVGALIESTVTETQRSIDGEATGLAGSIRFTTTDSLGYSLMPSILKQFRNLYPEIRVEMISTNVQLDLDRRDADVVLRPTGQPPKSWVGRRLGGLHFGVYVSRAYLKGRRGEDWRTFDWVVPAGPLEQLPVAQWLNAHVPIEQQVMAVDSFVAMRALAIEGVGATVLPEFMGLHKHLQLLQVLPPDRSMHVWLLTHVNLRHTRRINVFMQHVAQSMRDMSLQLPRP